MRRRLFIAAACSAAATIHLPARQSAFHFVLILIGPPGSGKTTHSRKLGRMYGVKEVCVPVLLKKSYGKKVKRKTPLAAPVESGELRGRADDTPATIERRLGEYRREAKMIEDFYGRREFHRIDATGSEQEVFAAIRAALGLP